MASETRPKTTRDDADRGGTGDALGAKEAVVSVLEALASLKFTVVLFAMAIFIVLAGTFAQTKMDNWLAVDKYFRTAFAFVEFDIFYPRAFAPNRSDAPVEFFGLRGFIFPGGWLIGLLMCVNLLAAHGLRFKVQAKGERRWGGIGALAVGALTTWLVVASGDDSQGMQASMTEEFVNVLWYTLVGGLAAVILGAIYGCVRIDRKTQGVEWWTSLVVGLGLAGLFVYIIRDLDGLRLQKESMRILWQLIKGQFAACVLLLGCWMLFKKRSGIVLLHGGVGLLMFSELLVGLYAHESQMLINEGETKNYSEDVRAVELAFVDESNPEHDLQVVVSEDRLKAMKPITHPDLPFVIQPLEFHDNTAKSKALTAEERKEFGDDLRGVAKAITLPPAEPANGLEKEIDMAAVRVRLENVEGESLGTWLFGQRLEPQDVLVNGKSYETSLRYARKYHPYSVHLVDAEHTTYVGAPSTPKDYSSYVKIVDPETGFEADDIRIWMNNPLRYRGETLYQSGMDILRRSDGRPILDRETGEPRRYTVLQVVTNRGWMLPYVCCMIVMTGMLVQFVITLSRFQGRRAREAVRLAEESDEPPRLDVSVIAAPAVVLAVALLFVGLMARPASTKTDELPIHEFGSLPVTADGRVKPMDSLARNKLVVVTERETFKPAVADGEEGKEHNDITVAKRSKPAIKWLLDTATDGEKARSYPVFRIVNTDLLDRLDLARRPGFFRYSFDEIMANRRQLGELIEGTEDKDPKKLTTIQKKAVALYEDISAYYGLQLAFRNVEMAKSEGQTETEYIRSMVMAGNTLDRLAYVIPSAAGDGSWEPYSIAAARDWLRGYSAKHELTTHRGVAARVLADMKQDGSFDRAFGAGVDEIVLDQLSDDFASFLAAQNGGKLDREQARREVQDLLENPPERLRTQIELLERSRRSGAERLIDVQVIQELEDGFRRVLKFDFDAEPSPYYLGMKRILNAYGEDDAEEFSTAVAEYREILDAPPEGDAKPDEYVPAKTTFEAWFNGFAPFWVGQWLYLLAFVLAAAGWLGFSRPLNAASFWLVIFTLLLHTFAIVGRIYISGRPPVTNLYSSAVFIAWGCAVMGIILELVFRIGLGNAIAGIMGFVGLGIAHYLSRDGDTIAVMQAVLDTNIWLATHVVTVTMGYAATFLAGFFGLYYVLAGVLTRALSEDREKKVARMIYGTVCFAMFFSFVGTVLGGLWADDSWGRFWGWDPKENGALIIVLWNALVLHARWDGMVKNRGLAVLAILGNITTAWSWFGTNELGAGLHAYGFTEGVLMVLGLFVFSQLAVAGVGCLPKSVWQSRSDAEGATA